MKTGFPNIIEPRNKGQEKAPWNFDQPPYDQRTSCYVNAGSHYGQGKTQPVGHDGVAKQRAPCLPFGRVDTMVVAKTPLKNLPIEIEE